MACDFWVTLIRSAGSPKKRKQAKLEVVFDNASERQRVSHGNGARRRRGARERV